MSLSAPGLKEAAILAAALPFMQHYEGKVVVIKYGGQALENAPEDGPSEGSDFAGGFSGDFAGDIALLRQIGVRPVLVHGGGPQISAWSRKLGIEPVFDQGRRRTGPREAEIAEMVLGKINKHIVRRLHRAGAQACGISGSDGALFTARPLGGGKKPTSGKAPENLTGEICDVRPRLVELLLANSVIPVIAPLAPGSGGEVYNINADDAAGALAGALGAARLMLLTDVPGIMDADKKLLTRLSPDALTRHIKNGQIAGGMVPKAQTCIAAIKNGVEAAVILDGRAPHALLLELFTPHGAGTLIEGVKAKPKPGRDDA